MVNLNLPMKRGRELDSITAAMANCLMLLSRQHAAAAGDFSSAMMAAAAAAPASGAGGRVFECKTCNRQFPSFQALGGHRASHKRPRLMGDLSLQAASPPKPKTHECSICGLEFGLGQALGGHMRRHRAVMNNNNNNNDSHSSGHGDAPAAESGGRRALCLDLNLTPLENDLEFKFGKVAAHHHVVDCFL